MADKDILDDAKERFKLSADAESDNRQWALEDIEFARLGKQWPDAVLSQREREGRPCLTINRLPAFARQIVNDARQNKPAIKVKPADSGADVKTAEIYNGLIRNIEVSSNAEIAYDTALECAVYGGFGYWRVKTDYAHDDTFDLDLCIERVANPFTVYGDPKSQAADASDWRWGFVTELLSRDEFASKYGKNAKTISWSADKDERDQHWQDEDKIRIAEHWVRDEVTRPIVKLSTGIVLDADAYKASKALFDAQGIVVVGERETRSWKVTQHILTGAEVLESVEWSGRYIPIIPVYGDEVNVEGKRYFRSLVRDVRDAQLMYNYWRTATAELVALAPKAPFIGEQGSFDNDPNWKTANTKSHAYLEYKKGAVPPQRQPFAGVPAGAMQEALTASDDMKAILGIYDASLGARSNETSGRAIMARQREGDVSTFHYIDNLSRAIRYCGRVLIDLIPTVYNAERMIRVLGEDGAPKVVQIAPGQEQMPPGVYDLTRGKYDLVVESGPSYTTKREEINVFLTEVLRANPATAPLLMDVIVRNMDFPESDKIAARFKAMLPPPIQALEQQDEDGQQAGVIAQQLVQAQMQIQQMQQALQQAEIQRTQLDAAKLQQEGAIEKARLDLEARKVELDKYQAELDANVKVYVEQLKIGAQQESQAAQMQAEDRRAQPAADAAMSERMSNESLMAAVQEIMGGLSMMRETNAAQMQAMQALVQAANAPKRVVRDPVTNRAIGVEPVPPEAQ